MGRTISRIDRKLTISLSKKQLSLLAGSSDVKDMGKDIQIEQKLRLIVQLKFYYQKRIAQHMG